MSKLTPQILDELLDEESRAHWFPVGFLIARDSLATDARIKSAYTAKARGIPLWKWANDYANASR